MRQVETYEIKIKIKLAVVVHVPQTTQTLVIPRSLFCRGRQRNVPRIITPLFCSLEFLFSDGRVAVAVVVFLNFLLYQIELFSTFKDKKLAE